MTSEVAAGERPVPMASESPALASLRRAYEARGFTFLAEPPRDALPDFLGAYRPDAIARGPGGGIIIEVKRGGRAHRESALAEVARRVAGQEGWEFRVGDRPESGGPYTDPRNERRAHRSAVAWS